MNMLEIVKSNAILLFSRLKSKTNRVALFTNLLFILKTFGLLEQFGISEEEYQGLTVAITMVINIIAGVHNPDGGSKVENDNSKQSIDQ